MGSGATVELSESGGLVLRGPCLGEDGSLGHLSHVCVCGVGAGESAGCRRGRVEPGRLGLPAR